MGSEMCIRDSTNKEAMKEYRKGYELEMKERYESMKGGGNKDA